MDARWQVITQRFVQGLNCQPGELIEVRDGAGRLDVLEETLLAIEHIGATPLLQFVPDRYLERLWSETPAGHLSHWDLQRGGLLKLVDRILFLGGAKPDFELAPKDGLESWSMARDRLTIIEEARRLPFLLAAIPTERSARQVGLTLEELEEILLPGLGASVESLRHEINRILAAIGDGQSITLTSGDHHILHLEQGDREWLRDDGWIDSADQQGGAIVSNLPAGSIYTTVLEDKTQGSLWLAEAGEAKDVVFRFVAGRIVEIEAASGADLLRRQFDSHTGEPRRVSHVGVGLNPFLHKPVGWTLIDEHIHGSLFIALGENRYMGGQNGSSLNIDYALAGCTLKVDGRLIVSKGELMD